MTSRLRVLCAIAELDENGADGTMRNIQDTHYATYGTSIGSQDVYGRARELAGDPDEDDDIDPIIHGPVLVNETETEDGTVAFELTDAGREYAHKLRGNCS